MYFSKVADLLRMIVNEHEINKRNPACFINKVPITKFSQIVAGDSILLISSPKGCMPGDNYVCLRYDSVKSQE